MYGKLYSVIPSVIARVREMTCVCARVSSIIERITRCDAAVATCNIVGERESRRGKETHERVIEIDTARDSEQSSRASHESEINSR